jgi:hypothetical protein
MRPIDEEKNLLTEVAKQLHVARASVRAIAASRGTKKSIRDSALYNTRKKRAAARKAAKAAGDEKLLQQLAFKKPVKKQRTEKQRIALRRKKHGSGGSVWVTFASEFSSLRSGPGNGIPKYPKKEKKQTTENNNKKNEDAAEQQQEEGGEGEEQQQATGTYIEQLHAWLGDGPTKCIVKARGSTHNRFGLKTKKQLKKDGKKKEEISAIVADLKKNKKLPQSLKGLSAQERKKIRKQRKKMRRQNKAKRVTAILSNQKSGNAFVVNFISTLRKELAGILPQVARGSQPEVEEKPVVVASPAAASSSGKNNNNNTKHQDPNANNNNNNKGGKNQNANNNNSNNNNNNKGGKGKKK